MTVIGALEDSEDYKAFEAAVIADYDAQSAVERELVLRLASLLWRLRRATTMETGLLEIQADHLREFRQGRQAQPTGRDCRRRRSRCAGSDRSDGFFAYHAVPTNFLALEAFRLHTTRIWRRVLRRRSQKDGFTWKRIEKLAADFLPTPRILHPWPSDRFAVKHPRWEPYAGNLHVRICAGGVQ